MNRFLKIIAGFFIVVGLGVGAVFYFTSALSDEADEFFAAVQKEEYQTAYGRLSSEFQKATSVDELTGFLKQTGLTEISDHSWGKRNISMDQGTLSGTVSTKAGSTFPFEMTFVKEGGAWKILNMHKTSAGASESNENSVAKGTLPPEAQQIALVQKALFAFGESIKEKNMTKFHNHISQLWRNQYTVEKLDDAYKSIYAIEGDLTKISKLSPIFDQSVTLDQNGVMKIAGHFPTEPHLLNFEQKFIREGTDWKLLGFSINFTQKG